MRLKILYFALILFGITFAQAHAQIAATRKGEDKNSARVARIMARALARCRSQVHGFSKISWVPPTNDDVQEIEAMGELAVVPLSRYVDSERKDGFSELIAVRLLAAIGGQIVEVPLRRALASDQWEVTRTTALDALSSISKDRARPFVEAALSDNSLSIRQRASELYRLYYSQAK